MTLKANKDTMKRGYGYGVRINISWRLPPDRRGAACVGEIVAVHGTRDHGTLASGLHL